MSNLFGFSGTIHLCQVRKSLSSLLNRGLYWKEIVVMTCWINYLYSCFLNPQTLTFLLIIPLQPIVTQEKNMSLDVSLQLQLESFEWMHHHAASTGVSECFVDRSLQILSYAKHSVILVILTITSNTSPRWNHSAKPSPSPPLVDISSSLISFPFIRKWMIQKTHFLDFCFI